MQKTYSVITSKLKMLREKNGYSQEKIAEVLNKSQTAYGKIELGKTELTFKDANEIAKILNAEPADFIYMPPIQNNITDCTFSNSSVSGNINIQESDKEINTKVLNLLEESIKLIKELKTND